jgi:hypothetical protein
MARKVKEVKIKLDEARAKLVELETLAALAESEEQAKIENAKSVIDSIGKDLNAFIGVILTPSDLVAILDLALKSRENIKIPYTLYFND